MTIGVGKLARDQSRDADRSRQRGKAVREGRASSNWKAASGAAATCVACGSEGRRCDMYDGSEGTLCAPCFVEAEPALDNATARISRWIFSLLAPLPAVVLAACTASLAVGAVVSSGVLGSGMVDGRTLALTGDRAIGPMLWLWGAGMLLGIGAALHGLKSIRAGGVVGQRPWWERVPGVWATAAGLASVAALAPSVAVPYALLVGAGPRVHHAGSAEPTIQAVLDQALGLPSAALTVRATIHRPGADPALRELEVLTRTDHGVRRTHAVVTYPADLEGIALVLEDVQLRPDDVLLRVPARPEQGLERLEIRTRSDSILGSTLVYEDLDSAAARPYLHETDEQWSITSRPNESSYRLVRTRIRRPDASAPARLEEVVFYDHDHSPIKELRVQAYTRVLDRDLPVLLEVRDLERGSSTTIEVLSIRTDVDVSLELFSAE